MEFVLIEIFAWKHEIQNKNNKNLNGCLWTGPDKQIAFLRNDFLQLFCCSITVRYVYFFFSLFLLFLLLFFCSWFSLSIGDDILNRPRQICKFNTSISNGFDLCVVLLLLLHLDTHCLFYFILFFVCFCRALHIFCCDLFYSTILFVFSSVDAHLYSPNA